MAMLNNQRVFHRFMGIFTGEIPIKTTFSGGMVPFTPWFQTSQSSKGPASFVAPPGDPVHCRKGTRRWHIWRRVPSKTSWFSKDIFLFFYDLWCFQDFSKILSPHNFLSTSFSYWFYDRSHGNFHIIFPWNIDFSMGFPTSFRFQVAGAAPQQLPAL